MRAKELPAGVLAAALCASTAYATVAATRSHFFCDDMMSLYQLRGASLWEFLTIPVNVQLVPLHRLATWAIDGLFGFRFTPAVLVLLGLQWVSVLVLYRLATKLVALVAPATSAPHTIRTPPRLLPAVLAFLLASYPFLGIQLMWFSSGLHRLPYAIATLFAFERWLVFRERPSPFGPLAIAAAAVVATGFYSKGPLLVPHVIALEVCLWTYPATADRRQRLVALLGLLGLSVLLALGIAHQAGGDARLRILNWGGLLWAEGEALRTFLKAFIGQVNPRETLLDDPGSWCVLILVTGLITASVRARRSNATVWLTVLAVLAANTALIATSNRGAAWGIMVARAPRYHWDLIVVALPLAAIGLAGVRFPRPRRFVGLTTAGLLLCVALLAFGGFYGRLETRYRDWLRTRSFMDNFERSLSLARTKVAPDELVFKDELLPPPLFCMGTVYHRFSHMAVVMEEPLRFSDDGKLLIYGNGMILPKGPDYDPERREKAVREYIRDLKKATSHQDRGD